MLLSEAPSKEPRSIAPDAMTLIYFILTLYSSAHLSVASNEGRTKSDLNNSRCENNMTGGLALMLNV